jgi:hypothetical protein
MQEKISCSSFAPGLNKIEKSIEKSIGKIFMLKLEYWNRLQVQVPTGIEKLKIIRTLILI